MYVGIASMVSAACVKRVAWAGWDNMECSKQGVGMV